MNILHIKGLGHHYADGCWQIDNMVLRLIHLPTHIIQKMHSCYQKHDLLMPNGLRNASYEHIISFHIETFPLFQSPYWRGDQTVIKVNAKRYIEMQRILFSENTVRRLQAKFRKILY